MPGSAGGGVCSRGMGVGVSAPEGVCSWGVSAPGGCLLPGVCLLQGGVCSGGSALGGLLWGVSA